MSLISDIWGKVVLCSKLFSKTQKMAGGGGEWVCGSLIKVPVFQDHRAWVKFNVICRQVGEQDNGEQQGDTRSAWHCLSISGMTGHENLEIILVIIQSETSGCHPLA